MLQVMTMAVLSLGWLGAAAVSEVQQGEPIVTLWEGYRDPIAWLVLLWPAVGQYSTGEAAQVAGQARCVRLFWQNFETEFKRYVDIC